MKVIYPQTLFQFEISSHSHRSFSPVVGERKESLNRFNGFIPLATENRLNGSLNSMECRVTGLKLR